MSIVKKILAIFSLLTLTACGMQPQEEVVYYKPLGNSATGQFLVLNPTPYYIPIILEPDLTAISAKTLNLAAGDQFDESVLNPGVTTTVAGCFDERQNGGSNVCFEDYSLLSGTAYKLTKMMHSSERLGAFLVYC